MVNKKSQRGRRSDGIPGAKFVKNTDSQTVDNSKKQHNVHRKFMKQISEDTHELFDEETRSMKCYDNEMEIYNHEAAPPSATIPPMLLSVDLLPISYAANQDSNIIVDENSMDPSEIDSALGYYSRTVNDEGTVRTTSTMMTAQIRNMDARWNHSSDIPFIEENSTRVHTGIRRFTSKSFKRSSNNNQLMIDTQGQAITEEEMKLIWAATGKCVKCGVNTTHQKEKYGPLGMFRRMIPQTEEGKSYKGYCLYCYDVPMLRRILHEPDIPLDLTRQDMRQSSLRMIQLRQDGISELPNVKQSPVVTMCSSMRFQMCCFIVVLLVAGAIVLIGIKVAKQPDVWISQPPSLAPSNSPSTSTPSSSPTSYAWNLHSEVISDYTSFGQKVKLSNDGSILAVSSPYFDNGKGRFDVYTIEKGSDETTWSRLLPLSGTKVQGTNSSAIMSHGMSLSADGSTLAIGSPGYGNGLVDIYMIDLKTNTISQKGSSIQGPTPLCEFGFSVALNSLGTRLFVGAPNYGQSISERIGLVRAYDYNNVTDSWIQVGSDMTGESINSRFGHSIASSHDGLKIIIGAPFDGTKFERAGKVYCFTLNKYLNTWYHFPYNYYYGDNANSQLGYNTVANEKGEHFAFSVETSSYDEEYKGAGVIEACYIGSQFNSIDTIGYPISGIHEDAYLGCQIDMDASGAVVVASEQHSVDTSGTVWVYNTNDDGILEVYGPPILGYPKGSCQPRGRGSSVSIVTSGAPRLAIGYECILINGEIKSAVHVYDYCAISE
jgi:hypothetical protein